VAPGSEVWARLRTADGRVLAEANWSVPDAVTDPRAVGTLTVDARDVPTDAVVVWDLDWRSADDVPIDREIVVACTGSDFAPLLDLGPATLAVDVRRTGEDGFVVVVEHRDGPLVVGLRLLDDRPPDATGWLIADGDPRPLLPGERREFGVRMSHSDAPPVALLDSWNTEPIRLDLDKEPVP
jgi:beta-mannosidase